MKIHVLRRLVRKWGRAVLPALIATFLLQPTMSAAQPAGPTREWTILIFMNGKNDLEPFAIEDFEELAAIGSTDDVGFVVQMGRPLSRPGYQASYEEVHDGWTGVRRFYVTRGQTPATGQEVENVGGPEVDMGSPDTLRDFLEWGKRSYPAKRYAVVIWNHGQGYRLMSPGPDGKKIFKALEPAIAKKTPVPTHRAVSADADTRSIIYNSDIRSAIDGPFGDELRLVGFDACLMAMVETAYELRNVAPLIVASEELEPGAGWNYTLLANALIASPASDENALATMIVDKFREHYGNSDGTTLSTVRTAGIAPLAAELSTLSDLVIADRTTMFPLLAAARADRKAYNTPRNPVSVDLIGLLNAFEAQLTAKAPASPVLAQTRRTREVARAVVADVYASSSRTEPYGSYGIAIFFPASKRAFNKDPWSEGYRRNNSFKPIAFVHDERWSTLLAAYLGF